MIYPYKNDTKKPMSKNKLKSVAPYIYKYLDDIEHKIGNGSSFSKVLMNHMEFCVWGIIFGPMFLY
ncbi:hypothetical protein [Campylobacter sputorum]|uniref:hypothetical protein n=1 Tax=Campylobacter sputorum TaxID=206 RepID=UPI00053BF208|nr:hypothetical protein [Campylobacter sputorum]